jgi:hypothetical protein
MLGCQTSHVSLPSQNGAIAFRIEFHDPQRLAEGASRPSTTIFAFTILVGQAMCVKPAATATFAHRSP